VTVKEQVTCFCEGNHGLINELESCSSDDLNFTPRAGRDLLCNLQEA